MSHLHEILNPDQGRSQSSKLSDETDPVDQLELSSSAEDDISPGKYRRPKVDHRQDPYTARKEEKRPEPAPRRRLEKHDRKIDLGLHDHKAHADCPDTLACLPDTPGRPQHTLPVILRCAILGSPRKRLTIREIYATMESKYPYYKTAGQTWKAATTGYRPGFGSYWTVNLAAPPGTKRPRKRGRPNKDGADGSASKKSSTQKSLFQAPHMQNMPLQPTKFQFQPQTHPPPPPPPLPQPQSQPITLLPPPPPPQVQHPPPPPPHPKVHQQQQNHQHHNHHQPQPQPRPQHKAPPPAAPPIPPSTSAPSITAAAPTRTTTPRSVSSPITSCSTRGSTYPPSSKDSETEDGGLMDHDESNGPTISEDEYESEEDMNHGYHRRDAMPGHIAFVPTRPSPIFSLPPFSALSQNREDVIEHMRQEIATLRRTSAEAVSTSIRLSEQLANANLEVSRSREAVRDLEDMLQDEAVKRKEAERLKDLEMERRRAAEHALSSLSIRAPNRVRTT
ncbi:hypothetical protein BDZ97DRAFT_1753001 [Flammula alnicola]|nr:hypothetical protein BDZ97DRAFT_1753001 [Flammula alnicola]